MKFAKLTCIKLGLKISRHDNFSDIVFIFSLYYHIVYPSKNNRESNLSQNTKASFEAPVN